MKSKGYAKIIIWIIVLYIFVSVLIPIIFKYAIFENPALSNLSNNEWAGFLGSYVGGILGGLGTLIALYITVKNSMTVQEENKKDTDQRIEEEYKRHQADIAAEKERRDKERLSDKEDNDKRDRQQFVNNIAKELGVYITHISKYHFAGLEAERLQDRVSNAKTELFRVEQKLKSIDDKLSAVDVNDSDEFLRVSTERDTIVDEKDQLSRIYNEALAEQRSNSEFGNRLTANEAFFTLKVVLGNITFADDLLKKLEEVHKGAGFRHPEEETYSQWINLKTEDLIQEFTVFMDRYVDNVEQKFFN